ncbi:MAG TPA: hypothetical protein VFS02_18280, partial [Telluria sp.]|nr:hypothetical protein [Telluria sp.]
MSPLNLRREPGVSTPSRRNVIASLPGGQPVRAISFSPDEIEQHPVRLEAALAPRDTRMIAAIMPVVRGRVTRRRDEADALSLNEPGQPGRTGTSPADLRT